jgi:hypothetical protein
MRMSVCFLPIDLRQNITHPVKFRYTQKLLIPCQISKNNLTEIMTVIFTNYKFTAFGYNNRLDEFWCKKNKKSKANECVIYFTLNILSINNNVSKLVITPLSGNDFEFDNLLNDINKSLHVYQPSSTL